MCVDVGDREVAERRVLTQARYGHGGKQGVPPKVEKEVSLHRNVLSLKYGLPRLSQFPFKRCGRRQVSCGACAEAWTRRRRQTRTVRLSVGKRREDIEHFDECGHHIARQTVPQHLMEPFAQFLLLRAVVCPNDVGY